MLEARGEHWSIVHPDDWEVLVVPRAEFVAREPSRADGLFLANLNVVPGECRLGETAADYVARQADETIAVLGEPLLVDRWAQETDGRLEAEVVIAHVLEDGVRVTVVQRHVGRRGVGLFVASATCETVEFGQRRPLLESLTRSLEVFGD